jgi:HPt (histidine-containing phosphotransfer) domain-containing protein
VKAALPRYLRRRRTDLETLRESLFRREFDQIRRLGHDMKGTGSSYGCPDISEIGKALELAAKIEAAEEIHDLIARLTQTMDVFEQTVSN